ncbi:hypothetical protein MKW92_011311 [Papaver armeniacum]|nr:hypothetical protein MKW92_011311 [Papaver armeniacum]
MSDPKYAYPYPAQGTITSSLQLLNPYLFLFFDIGVCLSVDRLLSRPPVMPPPQYAAPPPRREPSFLEGCLAALCCCCLIDECCCDPSIIFIS